MTCMAVTRQCSHPRRDEQCGRRATRQTKIGGHPVCDEHAALSGTTGLVFDLGNSRLYTAVGAAMVDL